MSGVRLGFAVFTGGAVLMALEILSSRVLAPRFGSSVYVWGSIISVFLAALAIGYWWGGRLADRDPTLAGLGRRVAWAAAGVAVVRLAGEWAADLLGAWTGGGPAGTLAAAALLFAPPSLLLATLSPYAVRIAAHDLARVGHTAGGLYALSTAGSLVGTLGCTFVLIPFLEVPTALSILLAATAATALVALSGDMRRERWAVGGSAALLVLALLGPPSLPSGPEGLVHERTTAHQTLRVVDRDGVRYLESDGTVHGAVRLDDGELAMSYPRGLPAAWLIHPGIERVLILGLGGGNVADYLLDSLPGLAVAFVEVDPAVPEVAREWMGFDGRYDVAVHVADARRFLETTSGSWDLIVADTYIGLSVPFHLTTREFLAEVERRLAPGGVFAVNLAADLHQPFPRAIHRTVAAVFPTVYAFTTPTRNHLLFATREPPVPEAELGRRARALDARTRFDPDLATLLDRRLDPPPPGDDVPVLTDAYAPVDRLIHLERSELP